MQQRGAYLGQVGRQEGMWLHSERGGRRRTRLRCGYAFARVHLPQHNSPESQVKDYVLNHTHRRDERVEGWIDAASDRARWGTIRGAYVAAEIVETFAQSCWCTDGCGSRMHAW